METYYNNRLQGYAGDSKEVLCFVCDSSGAVYDISGYSGYFYMKKYPVTETSTLDVSTAATSTDTSTGSILFNLTSTQLDLDEGDYIYEVVIDDGAGTIKTVIQDRFNILKSLT